MTLGCFTLDLYIFTAGGAYTRWQCLLREVQITTLSPALTGQRSVWPGFEPLTTAAESVRIFCCDSAYSGREGLASQPSSSIGSRESVITVCQVPLKTP